MARRFLSNVRINDAYTLPASDGTNNQVIKTDGSGNLTFGQLATDSASVIYKDTFTGDGSTTAFTMANALNDENQSNIYIDGVYQSKSTYSVANKVITFSTAPASGHAIEVISTTGINSGPTAIYTDNFTANGSTTAFTLGQTVHDENQTLVFLNGVYQFKNTYTLSGTTLTLDTAPANGVAIEVMSIGSAYSGGDILYDHDFTSAGLMKTNGSGTYSIVTDNSSNWNTAYTYSQVGHLPLAGGTVSGNLIVTGDLTINGNTTTLNTQTIEVEDNILQLNTTQGSPDTATATTSGISIYRGNGVTQASFIFDDADDTWDLTNNLVVAGDVSITGGDLTLGTDSIASNINSVGDVLVFNVDSNANTGGTPNMQFKVSGTTELTLNSTTATFAGTITAAGGSSNNNDDANILTLNASEHARLLVDTSSTSGHRATLALESNGNELLLTTTGSASELTSVGNLTVTSSATTFSGVLALPDGSASAPAIGNTGDTNTGMYWPGDHQVGFAVNGSRKFYISETEAFFQNLSSGVSINAGGIDVTGNSTFAGTVTFNDHTYHPDQVKSIFGTGSDAEIQFNGSHLFIDNTVGTTYLRNTATGGSGFIFRNSSIGDFEFDNEFAGNIKFNTSNVQRMRIDSGGSIIIGDGATSGTPAADYRSLEIGRQGNTITGAPWKSNLYFSTNATVTAGSTAFTYRYASAAPTQMTMENGVFTWSNAAAGTAGNTISWSEKMRITSAGNLGVGTTSPNQSGFSTDSKVVTVKAPVSGGAAILELIGLGNSDNNTVGALNFMSQSGGTALSSIKGLRHTSDTSGKLRFDTAGSERMRITEAGNVGIGRTTDTAKKLDVLGTGFRLQDNSGYSSITIGASSWNQDYPYLRLDTFNSDGTGYFWALGHRKTDGTKTVRMLISDTSSRYVTVIDQLNIATFASNELGGSGNYPSFTTNVVIRNSGDSYFNGGDVGIGTTSPSGALHVYNGSSERFLITGDVHVQGSTDFNINGSNRRINFTSGNGTVRTTTANSLIFATNSTERMRIHSSGQVWIRRTADYSTDKYLLQVGDASLDDCIPAVFTVASTSARNQIVFSNYNNNLVGTIITSGSATSYNTSSDYRLKEDLKDFNGLEKISDIKVYDFKWKDNDNYDEHSKRGYGVMAHELEKVLPQAVNGEKDAVNKDGSINPQGVDYAKIVPLLVKSIQELKAEIETLKNQING